MGRYNIALIPIATGIQESFVQYAQTQFGSMSDEYLLGDNAEMHITLCQFRASGHEMAVAAYHAVKSQPLFQLILGKIHLRPVQLGMHKRLWIEALVEPNDALRLFQQRCWQTVVKEGLEPLTNPATYVPHVSFARLNADLLDVPEARDLPFGKSIVYRPALGVVTERGAYVETIAL